MTQPLLAYIFTGVVAVVAVFQLALMCGAPFGHLAMGGRFPARFPATLRVAALVQAILLAFFALVTLSKAKVLWVQYYDVAENVIWVVVAVSGLSLIMNLVTPSKWERILWAPVAGVMLLTSGLLAAQVGA